MCKLLVLALLGTSPEGVELEEPPLEEIPLLELPPVEDADDPHVEQLRLAGLTTWIARPKFQQQLVSAPVMVMLHGYGRPARTLRTQARRAASYFGTTVVMPEGPAWLGLRRRAWWKRTFATREAVRTRTAPPGMAQARERIIALLHDLRWHLALEPRHVVLAGFSQGGTLALDVALHETALVGGLAVLSGKLTPVRSWQEQWPQLRAIPVFVAHGRDDHMAPFGAAQRVQRLMRAAGVLVTWIPYEGGHATPPSARRLFARFVQETLGLQARPVVPRVLLPGHVPLARPRTPI